MLTTVLVWNIIDTVWRGLLFPFSLSLIWCFAHFSSEMTKGYFIKNLSGENNIIFYWAEILSSVRGLAGSGTYNIVDLPQDNGTNATNSYSLKGNMIPTIIMWNKTWSYYCTDSCCSWNIYCCYVQIIELKCFQVLQTLQNKKPKDNCTLAFEKTNFLFLMSMQKWYSDESWKWWSEKHSPSY